MIFLVPASQKLTLGKKSIIWQFFQIQSRETEDLWESHFVSGSKLEKRLNFSEVA